MNFYLMRHQWKPVTGTPGLLGGGRWKLKCTEDEVPVVWSNLILALVGEVFNKGLPQNDDICGLSWSSRSAFSIWHTNTNCKTSTEAALKKIFADLLPKLKNKNLAYSPNQKAL